MKNRAIHPIEQKETEEKLPQTSNTLENHLSRKLPGIWQEMLKMWEGKPFQEKYAEGRVYRCPKMTTDKELFMTCAKTMKMQRWQHRYLTCEDQTFSAFIV